MCFEVEIIAFRGSVKRDVSIPERFTRDLKYSVKLCVAEVLEVSADPFHLPPVFRSLLAHLSDATFPVPSLWELGEGRLNA